MSRPGDFSTDITGVGDIAGDVISFNVGLYICRPATGVLLNIDHKKKPEYRPNIDHTALYRPNIDHKSYLKSTHLHYLLGPEIYTFCENEAFREI